MADADEATTALIAKMLAEDNPYGDEDMYGLRGGGDSDSDWEGKKAKKRKKPAGAGRPKKEKAPIDPSEIPEFTESGRKKRKDTGKKMRAAPRAWTEEEELKFREALKLFGREWKKCAEHVGTRDAKAFTSHAQKYFIKLCLQGKQLPARVRESGDGYTLSGKPLDPESAAAKAYGFKPDSLQKMAEQGVDTAALPGLAVGGAPAPSAAGGEGGEGSEGGEDGKENTAANAAPPPPPDSECELPVGAPKPPKPAAPKKERKPSSSSSASASAKARDGSPLRPPSSPTEYAKSRPKRESAGVRSFLGSTSESLDLCTCREFVGSCGSGGPLAQPYKVDVSPDAMLVMDLHAHLSCAEVIGFLGGDWDPLTRRIAVREAFPCRSTVDGEQSRTSCEMDPEAEVAVRGEMEAKNMSVVGWYHSHPVFAPSPSSKDVDNQLNYQKLFHHAPSGVAPFVGVIVGPYDTRLPDTASKVEVFCTQQRGGEKQAMRVQLEGAGAKAGAGAGDEWKARKLPGEDVLSTIKKLVDDLKLHPGSITFSELWRGFTSLAADGQPSGGPVTKLAKMRGALRKHLLSGTPEAEDEAEEWLDGIATHLQTSWGLDLGY